jgi:hypothetical protein
MTEVDWEALRAQQGYDSGVAELRAASSRLRQEADLDDVSVRSALAELFTGLADDAETTGPDPRALAVARALAVLAPRAAAFQLEQRRPAALVGPEALVGEVLPSVATAVAAGRPATRADLVIARVAVAAAAVWHRLRRR